MKITIDRDRCQGHARCCAIAFDVFEIDDLGYIATQSGEIPDHLEHAARKGAAVCPERVITLS